MTRRLMFDNAVLSPDPFERGKEGQVLIYLNADGNYAGIASYDYDKGIDLPEFTGVYKTYRTIIIGEHEVTTENLLIPYRNKWQTYLEWVNFSQYIIDQMNNDYEGKENVSLSDFTDINGSYVSLYDAALSYRDSFKVLNVDDRVTDLSGWRLMASTDFHQLMGVSPLSGQNRLDDYFNFLACGLSDYSFLYNSDWNSYRNISGFSAVPLGRRESGVDGVNENGNIIKWREYKKEAAFRLSDYPNGMIMFSSSMGVRISSSLYHFGSARYIRHLVPSELGYRLCYSVVLDDVKVFNPSESIGSSYVEMSVSAERGIALRYMNREHRVILRKYSEIKQEADLLRASIRPY